MPQKKNLKKNSPLFLDSIPKEAENGTQNASGYFVCTICNREFSGLNSLRKHVPIHTRKVQHKCDVCGHVFGKKEYLLDHMRKHTGEVSPLCEVCGQTFSKTLKLKEHFKVHRNVEENGVSNPTHPFKCHICLSVFKFTSALGKHLISVHSESFIKCDLCNATFGDIRGKNHHMLSEHQSDPFSQKKVWCPVCNQGFTRAYNLKVHMYKNHGKEYTDNNFSKEDMAAAAASTAGGKSAKFNHYFDPKQGTQMLQCQMCDRKFVRKNDLYIHLDADHGVMLVGCSSCEEKFLDVLTLQEHITEFHGGEDKKTAKKRKPGPASKTNAPLEQRVSTVRCEICQRNTDSQAALREHVFTTHVKGYKFSCDVCAKSFEKQPELESHHKSKHLNLSKRAAQIRDALGLVEDGPSANKRACLSNSLYNPGTLSNTPLSSTSTVNPLTSASVISKSFSSMPSPFLSLSNVIVRSAPPLTVLSATTNNNNNNNDRPIDLSSKPKPSFRPIKFSDLLPVKPLDLIVKSNNNNNNNNNVISPKLTDIPEVDQNGNTKKDVLDAATALVSLNNNVTNNVYNKNGDLIGSVTTAPPPPPPPAVPAAKCTDSNNNNSLSTPPPPVSGGRRKNSSCPVCGVHLSPKTNVNVHLRTHSGVRPYECVLCLNRFRQKAHLMKHFRCSHNQKKPPHICQFCSHETVTSNDLYRHITDKHVKETDAMKPGLIAAKEEAARAVREANEAKKLEEASQSQLEVQVPVKMEETVTQPEEPVAPPPPPPQPQQPEEEDITYEAITEPFLFENQIIYPCYCVLPFVTDFEVDAACNPRNHYDVSDLV